MAYTTKPISYDVIIIGAGPAGLTAAIYTSHAQLNTLLVESPSIISNVFYVHSAENYPGFPNGISGPNLIERLKAQARNSVVTFEIGTVTMLGNNKLGGKEIWQVLTETGTYNGLSVIIASGHKPKELGIPAEQRLRGRGVSYCAICDAPLFKDRDIAVIGANNIALEEALFLSRFARHIVVITEKESLAAEGILKEKALSNRKIKFIYSAVVEDIIGVDKVERIGIRGLRSGKKDEILCSGVFIFCGLTPSTNFARGVVDVDKDGYIIVDERMQTSKEGIFACGDCRKSVLHQIITACSDGAVAAFSCYHYVGMRKGQSDEKDFVDRG